MMTDLEPLAVYDVRDGSYVQGEQSKPFDDWVVDHGIALADTYRMEIYLLDCLFARVFQYDRDEQGRFCLDPAAQDVARREPFDMPIESMPPVKPGGRP